MTTATFDQLMREWPWSPISGCPGRFVLDRASPRPSMADLVGDDATIHRFHSEAARDIILIVPFQDGGLISYERPDGLLFHTLNTPEGFERKLGQLGIRLPI